MKKEKFEKDSLLELFKEKGLKKMELSTIVGGIRDTLPPPPITGGVNDNVYFYGSAGGSVRDTMIDGRVSIDNCC